MTKRHPPSRTEETVAKLEGQWHEVSVRCQSNLDAGKPLAPDEISQLRRLLGTTWPGVGVVQAQEWNAAEAKAFEAQLAAQLAAWAAKESRGELFTLEEFKEQARALGSCVVMAEREAEALSDSELDERQRRVAKAWTPKALNPANPAFQFASGRLGCGFLAWPICVRHAEAHARGFSRAFSKREKKREARAKRELAADAVAKVKRWSECRTEDISFASLYSDQEQSADEEQQARDLLRAATLYEYARESWKLRGLLCVSACREKQRAHQLTPVFEGLAEPKADKALGGWFWFLQEFASELAANQSFVSLWREQNERVKHALWWLLKLKSGKTLCLLRPATIPHGYHLPVEPVSLALEVESRSATVWETVESQRAPRLVRRVRDTRLHGNKGVEVLAVKVNWADFDDRALGEAFAQLAGRIRPKKIPGPDPQGRNQFSEFLTPLRELAALRRVSWQKLPPNGAKELYRAAKRARQRFERWFPFGEQPENGQTLKQRAKKGGTPSAPKACG